MANRSVWVATDIGLVRKTNEDSFGLPARMSSGSDREDWQGHVSTTDGWAVIADGMGGHEAGEMASKAVVQTFFRLADRTRTERGVLSVIEEANTRIYDQMASGAGRPGMGSTIVGITFSGEQCIAFNIGDSRLYLARDGSLLRVSIDDTLGTGLAGRSHALTQSLGGTRVPMPLFPHIRRLAAAPEDMLLLCSDGLSDMLTDEEILEILNRQLSQPALALVDAALGAGGRDNVTAIVIGPEQGSHAP